MLSLLTREHCSNLRFPQLYCPDLLAGMRCLLPHAVVEARQLRGEILIDTQLHCQLSLLASNLLLQALSVLSQPGHSCQKTVGFDEGGAVDIELHADPPQCKCADVSRAPEAGRVAKCLTDVERCGSRLKQSQVSEGRDVLPVLHPIARARVSMTHIARYAGRAPGHR